MKATKRALSVILALVLCLACAPAYIASSAVQYSKAVYMIFTNPGEDCRSQMRIGWHSDEANKNCYVVYTTSDDPYFLKAQRVNGEYDDTAYKWFYERLTTNAASNSRFKKVFLDWGVELDNLLPDTEYIYRVYDGEGLHSKDYKFKTAGADQYSIVWMSDAHVNSASSIRLTDWRKMFDFASKNTKYPVAFQFFTGDTVTSGDRYADWLSVSKESFVQNYMIADIVGNHDVFDSIMSADKANYTDFWKSGEYFDIVFNNPKNGYTFNSQRIAGYLSASGLSDYANRPADELLEMDDGKLFTGAVDDTSGRCYWFNYNGLLFITFEYYSMMYPGDTQAALDWAGKVIEENEGKYDYIICANHVNLVNGGGGAFRSYGATDYAHLGKFLDQYNVDLFLAGDNHVYLRTDSIYDGAVNSDPQKGTYIVQAPCISRPQSFSAMDPAGFAVKQYSLAGKTVGGLVIDVDENGLTFTCITRESGRSPEYAAYDTFTVPKKERASNRLSVKDGAKFTVNGNYLNAPEGLTVQDVTDGIANTTVEVTDEDGKLLSAADVVPDGATVTVRNDGFTYPAAVMTVVRAVKQTVRGDLNGDGIVDNVDAALILRYDAHIINSLGGQYAAADVDGNGMIDSADAAAILKYEVQLIADFW